MATNGQRSTAPRGELKGFLSKKHFFLKALLAEETAK